jgi:hypothetical protein
MAKAKEKPPEQTMERIVSDRFVPETLNLIADAVLAYRPKPKSKAAKKRKRKEAKIAKS